MINFFKLKYIHILLKVYYIFILLMILARDNHCNILLIFNIK